MTGPSTQVDKMFKFITVADYRYRIDKNDSGKWDITQITYEFATDEKVKVQVTEESRSMLTELKRLDANRISREIYNSKGIAMYNIEDCNESLFAYESFFTEVEQQELKADLDRAISMLPNKQQLVLRQRYFEDMPTSVIAERERVKVSAISHRENRAKENLKKILLECQLLHRKSSY